ncbi:hypothetical protein M0R45_016156 [Rubus argutus]|uniref:Cytochrome P450 n=1 Tax=Rubus argutus TaxID=59490 RepID=A0AAW1XT31_RUBAR
MEAIAFDQSQFFPFPFMLSLIAIVIFICSIKYYCWHNPPSNKNPTLPPSPSCLKPWPIVGNLPEMLFNKPTFRWIHNLMDKMNTEIACFRFGNVHVISVTSPELSCEFLKKQDAVFASRPISISTRLVTNGYLTAALVPFGEQWKKMKRVITIELLSPARQRWLLKKRVEEADHLVRYVYNQCCISSDEGGTVNVRVAAQHYCTNVIRKMIFNRRYFGKGMEDGGPGSEEEEHVAALFTILKYIYSFCVSDYMPCLRGLDLDGQEKTIKNALEITRKYREPLIEERFRRYKKGFSDKEPEDLLDILVSLEDINGEPLLSSEEIKAQITEIMIATVDNPSNAFEWALAEMINQPELLQKATEELDTVVGRERLVHESDLSHLNYVKACAREAFRLHPVTPFNVPHVSMSNTTVDNYFIPKGSHVLLSRVGLGRNRKVWNEPLKFRPERHLKDDGSAVVLTESDLRFITFSTGMRGCVGTTLRTTMTVMLFARLLHGFSWDMPHDQSSVDLTESKDELFLATPLLALAKPRLPPHVYPAN